MTPCDIPFPKHQFSLSRVHQGAWAWSFQVVELLRYVYTEISLIKNMLFPAVIQIRVMITSFRYIINHPHPYPIP